MSVNNLLREVVDHYLEFIETGREAKLGSFAQWLADRTQPENTKQSDGPDQVVAEPEELVMSIARHWGQLSQFAAVWSKMAFQSLPMKTFAEFGLLQYVSQLKNPTKSELVQLSMLEKSTCYEIIRRLQQLGVIEEEKDREDKRIRRVKLTTEGKKWVRLGNEQLRKIARVLVGDLHPENQAKLLRILMQLNDFHGRLYEQDPEQVRKHYF